MRILLSNAFLLFCSALAACSDDSVSSRTKISSPTTDEMYTVIRDRADDGLRRWQESRDGRKLTWAWAIGAARAATEVYRATGEERFIDLALDGCAEIIDERDSDLGLVSDVTGVSPPSWCGMARPADKDGPRVRITEVTTTGAVIAACIRALQAAPEKRPGLLDKYVDTAFEAREYLNDNWCEFEDGFTICSIPTGIEPLNHWARYGDMLVQLYESTSDTSLLKDIHGFTKLMRSCTREVDGALLWDYRPTLEKCRDPDYGPIGEWFYKTRSTILFPFAVYRADLGFSEAFMRSLARRFDTIVRGNRLCERIAGECIEVEDRVNRHSTVALWMRLLPWNPEIKPQLVNLIKVREDIFPDGWTSSVWTIRGYARMLQYEEAAG